MADNEEKIIESSEENSVGAIRIASDVVATIASMAAAEIPGVAGMSGGITSGLAQMLGRKQMTKGVKVDVGDNDAALDIYVIVKYGVAIGEVAKQVQEGVKSTVETMTGLACRTVNVHVQGVSFPEPEAPAEEAPAE
ncbi:MAG: Asp23/Gls24 family envelope stress response protein [Firmicutes bacterium]|nr:Asp23/Gls24 family envelope stress response protein [Bacillota bacterium]